jgi:hypothetical protein
MSLPWPQFAYPAYQPAAAVGSPRRDVCPHNGQPIGVWLPIGRLPVAADHAAKRRVGRAEPSVQMATMGEVAAGRPRSKWGSEVERSGVTALGGDDGCGADDFRAVVGEKDAWGWARIKRSPSAAQCSAERGNAARKAVPFGGRSSTLAHLASCKADVFAAVPSAAARSSLWRRAPGVARRTKAAELGLSLVSVMAARHHPMSRKSGRLRNSRRSPQAEHRWTLTPPDDPGGRVACCRRTS